jgi:hypothetical protein
VRLSNSFVSFAGYLAKTIWPSSLSVYYPHPGGTQAGVSIALLAGSVLGLGLFSVLSFLSAMRRPYLWVGWLWYIGTLVPVIGLVQVGGQAMADRYTYIPLIGIFIMVVWGISELTGDWRYRTHFLAGMASIAVTGLAISSGFQVSYWRSSVALFEHSLAVTTDNWMAHFNLGEALLREGRIDEAIAHFHAGLRLNPGEVDARKVLGRTLGEQGRAEEAIAQFQEVLRYRPDDVVAHTNLGVALSRRGKFDEAVAHLREALRIEPGLMEARRNLDSVLTLKGKGDEGAVRPRGTLRFTPGDPGKPVGADAGTRRNR